MNQRSSPWLTLNIVSQLAFGLLAMTICLPSMQDWPAAFGTSQANVQLTFSAYIAAYGGFQLVYGPLSDRHGRRPWILVGLALAIAGSLLAASADSIALLVTARVLQGAGCAACMVIGRALVQDLFAGPDRTRMMAVVGMTMGLCPPAATLIGGQLHVRFGWRANFVLMAAMGAVLFVAAWRGLPAGRPASAGTAVSGWRPVLAGYASLLRVPGFAAYVAVLAFTAATFYCFLGGAPLVLAGYGVTPERIGLYVMCPPLAYIAGNIATTRLVRSISDVRIMQLGQAFTLSGILLCLAFALGGLHSPLALALPLLLLGAGHGFLVPPTLAGTVGLVPALAGSASAIAGLMQQIVGALGGYVVGLVTHRDAVNLALLMLAWAAAGCIVQVVVLGRRAASPAPAG